MNMIPSLKKKKIPQLYCFWQTYAVFTFCFFLCLKFISKDSRPRKHQTVKSLVNRRHPARHQLFADDQISHYTGWKCPTWCGSFRYSSTLIWITSDKARNQLPCQQNHIFKLRCSCVWVNRLLSWGSGLKSRNSLWCNRLIHWLQK